MTNDTIIAVVLIVLSFGVVVLSASLAELVAGMKEDRESAKGSPIKVDMSHLPSPALQGVCRKINEMSQQIADLEQRLGSIEELKGDES